MNMRRRASAHALIANTSIAPGPLRSPPAGAAPAEVGAQARQARKERTKVKKVEAKERRMKAKESGKAKEVHGHQRGTADTFFLHGNLFLRGNPFGDIKKERANTASRMK